MSDMIDGDAPKDWHDLQDRAARILRECGLEAETECDLALARGDVKVDVLARDPDATPPTLHVCECKHWQTAVPKNIVHAFRTVVADSGAHFGYVISSSGFQSGAYEAVSHSNVKLVSWLEFQELFAERWFHRYMAPTLIEEGDALHEYTEPFNSRIIKKAEQLGAESGLRFRELVEQHADPSLALLMLWFRPLSKEI